MIVQHTHCIGSEEIYKDKTILYGQGNFIFYNDEYVDDKSVLDTALLVKIIIEDKKLKIKYIPIERCEGLVKISDNKSIIKEFENRSNDIKKEDFININYEEFAKEMLNTYLKVFDRRKITNRLINKFLINKFYEKIYKKGDYIGISNIIECEAHRELLITGLKGKIKELEKEKK